MCFFSDIIQVDIQRRLHKVYTVTVLCYEMVMMMSEACMYRQAKVSETDAWSM